jgi:heme oxygenase (mycobilin-producing)
MSLFVALSRFAVANGMSVEVKTAFQKRPHLVDHAPGYVRMDVISPKDMPNEFWLITYWESEEAFRIWHHSHTYHESHKGIPKGLKLIPSSTEIRHFEHIAS